MDAESIARVLASVPMFSVLTDAERTELVAHVRARRSSRDEVVPPRRRGRSPLRDPVGLGEGRDTGQEGHAVVVAMERNGAVFGELALFDDAPRSATVTALARDPPAARAHGAAGIGTGRRSRVARRARRVAKCLLSLATAQAGMDINLTQDDLPSFVGPRGCR